MNHNRILSLATIAALGLTASPALAQVYQRDHREIKPVRDHRELIPPPSIKYYAPLSGAVGTTVTIKGDNFLGGTQVVLGDKVITPVSITRHEIKFEVPRRADDATIVLRAPNARRDLYVGSFDVLTGYGGSWNEGVTPSWKDDLYKEEMALRGNRNGRRYRSVRAIRARWNVRFLSSPKVQSELSLHARRTARLERMLRLSRAHGNARLTSRIRVLINKESARHDRAMNRLKIQFFA